VAPENAPVRAGSVGLPVIVPGNAALDEALDAVVTVLPKVTPDVPAAPTGEGTDSCATVDPLCAAPPDAPTSNNASPNRPSAAAVRTPLIGTSRASPSPQASPPATR
jgi:hypothetical protein